MLRTVKADSARFGARLDEVKKFDKVLQHMEGQLLCGRIFLVGVLSRRVVVCHCRPSFSSLL